MTKKTPGIIGAAVGLALFIPVALLPSLVYGGYAGVLLATGIFGAPLDGSFGPRVLIIFGMVLGVTAIAALFAVTGAAIGTGLSVIVNLVSPAAGKASAPAKRA